MARTDCFGGTDLCHADICFNKSSTRLDDQTGAEAMSHSLIGPTATVHASHGRGIR